MNRFTMALFVLSGCGGSGTLTLTTWGEAYIEEALPASEFEDGYTVHFTRFNVTIADFALATRTGETGPRLRAPFTVDVATKGPHTVEVFEEVEARKWDAVSWAIAPATAGANALEVAGTLSKDGVARTFAWNFALDTAYTDCSNDDLGEGVTLAAGAEETVELTIHGDHLFYDDLQSPDAKLRGQAIFEAGESDGDISLADLSAVPLTSLPSTQYGTGGASVDDLGQFVSALARTVGHFRGEGECVTSAR